MMVATGYIMYHWQCVECGEDNSSDIQETVDECGACGTEHEIEAAT